MPLFVAFWLIATSGVAAAARPNILVILADDMGYSDIGAYGGEIRTPNLDRLAQHGLRFTNFYNVGRCAPTRAPLLTGLYNHHAGVGHMVDDAGLPAYRGRLEEQAVTLAEALGAANYRTFMVGKWHVGTPREAWPRPRGFDRFYGCPPGDLHYFRMFGGRFLALDDEIIEPGEDWYSTEAYTEQAIAFLREVVATGQPFLGYVAFYAPHYPLQAREADIRRYRGRYGQGWEALRAARRKRQVEMGLVNPQWPMFRPDPHDAPEWEDVPDPEEMDLRMAVYAAQVDALDQGVGRIVNALEQLGELDNTLLLFLSDNGADAAGGAYGFSRADRGEADAATGTPDSYTSFGSGWAYASNTPFRGYKSGVYEGGTATPLIVHWPAGFGARGEVRRQTGHVIDVLPTLLAAAAAPYPAERNGRPTLPLDGRSLLPAFHGETIERAEPLFWEHEGARAVRDGRWKIVARAEAPWELYDLEADRGETRDLADHDPERVRTMAEAYQAWAERTGVEPWSRVAPLLERARRAQK